MNKFKKFSKLRSFNFKMTGVLAKREGIALMILLGIIAAFETFMIIRLFGKPNWNDERHLTFLAWYIFLLVASIGSFPVMLLGYKNKVSDNLVAWFIHGFSLAIIVWAAGITRLDMMNGGSPIVYLTVTIIIGGIIVTNPLFYLAALAGTATYLVITDLHNPAGAQYFATSGAIINVVVFIVMALVMAMKNFYIDIQEERYREMIIKRSLIDSLTGLGNEAAYLKKIDELNKKAENGTAEYMVVMLDVNNLKATNDKYGHRYGCSLVVKAGHDLPDLFETSSLFHVGGDEFIIIIEGKDYNKRDELVKEIANSFEYTTYKFDGVELIFSVAFGYAEYNGTSFKETLQAADNAMYENKKMVKAKYGFTSR